MVTALRVSLEGDGAWPDLGDLSKVKRGQITRIALLREGTSNGKHTIGALIELKDGSKVFAETTYALLKGAMDAFAMKVQQDDRRN